MASASHVVFQSMCNKNYLRYVNEQGQTHGYIQATEKDKHSQFVQFEEVPKSGTGWVHIRIYINNKYWYWRTKSESEHYIVAEAEEPDEDPSTWSCTLFDREVDGNAKTVRLRHIHLNSYASLIMLPGDPRNLCLYADSAEPKPDHSDVFKEIR